MRTIVAVTDNAWASFLRSRPEVTEANFWLPSAKVGFGGAAGTLFLFKAHFPQNRLVGGGWVSGFNRERVSEARRFFGEGNGVGSPAELVAAIHRRALHISLV